tara:strand:- start:5481 stop:6743 length:1263 start_codon:yes stop_codon:yes gene_type:complete
MKSGINRVASNLALYELYLLRLSLFFLPLVFVGLHPYANFYLSDFFIFLFVFSRFVRVGKIRGFFLLIGVFLVFWGYLIGAVFSNEFAGWHTLTASLQYGLVFLFLIALSGVYCDKNLYVSLFKSAVFGMVLIAILNLFLLFISGESFSSSAGRYYGLWGNPNSLGRQSLVCVSFVLAYVFLVRESIRVSFELAYLLLGVLVSFYLVMASASFGALASAFVLLLAFFLIYLGSNVLLTKKIVIGVGFFFLIAFLFLFFSGTELKSIVPEGFYNRVLLAESLEGSGSATTKINQMITGITIFINSPIVGAGVESGRYLNKESLLSVGGYVPFHSFWITVLVEGGLFSLLGYVLIYLAAIRAALSNKNYSSALVFLLFLYFFNLIIAVNQLDRYLWMPLYFCFINVLGNCGGVNDRIYRDAK